MNPLYDDVWAIPTSTQVPVDPKITRKFREMSESLWEVQQLISPQFAEVESLPLVTPSDELVDDITYNVHYTEAVTVAVSTLMKRIETYFQMRGMFGSILRCVLIRVKSGKQIYPHIDDTFLGIPHDIYRMQLVSSSNKDWWSYTDEHGREIKTSPVVNQMKPIPKGSIQSEENVGLNDNIHALIYLQRTSAKEELRKLTVLTP